MNNNSVTKRHARAYALNFWQKEEKRRTPCQCGCGQHVNTNCMELHHMNNDFYGYKNAYAFREDGDFVVYKNEIAKTVALTGMCHERVTRQEDHDGYPPYSVGGFNYRETKHPHNSRNYRDLKKRYRHYIMVNKCK